jgi:D-3-phosphoglycerate dehydrogenase
MQQKVLIATSTFAVTSREPLNLLKKKSIEYVLNPHQRTLTEEEIIRYAKDCTGIISGSEPLNERVISALPSLRCISRVGIGLDNVDLVAAEKRKIMVKNTPGAPTRAVAELTIAMVFDLSRGVTAHDREVRNGTWKKKLGWQVSGKLIGVIGLGRIGRLVAEMLAGLGARVWGTDLYPDPAWAKQHKVTITDMDSILNGCDVITLHVPFAKGSPALIGEKEIGRMKKGSYILNLSRGGIINEAALVSALRSGHLAGAAIDTFEKEPYHGPLAEMDNVILTPHMGSNTVESRQAMEIEAAQNLIGVLTGTKDRI